MFRYRNDNAVEARIPDAGNIVVGPGVEYDSEVEIYNATQTPVNDEAIAAAAARANPQPQEATS